MSAGAEKEMAMPTQYTHSTTDGTLALESHPELLLVGGTIC